MEMIDDYTTIFLKNLQYITTINDNPTKQNIFETLIMYDHLDAVTYRISGYCDENKVHYIDRSMTDIVTNLILDDGIKLIIGDEIIIDKSNELQHKKVQNENDNYYITIPMYNMLYYPVILTTTKNKSYFSYKCYTLAYLRVHSTQAKEKK